MYYIFGKTKFTLKLMVSDNRYCGQMRSNRNWNCLCWLQLNTFSSHTNQIDIVLSKKSTKISFRRRCNFEKNFENTV